MKTYTREEIQAQVQRGKAADRRSGARHRKRTAAEKAKWRKDHELDLSRRRAEIDAQRQREGKCCVPLMTPDELAAAALKTFTAGTVQVRPVGDGSASTIIERRSGAGVEYRAYGCSVQ